MNIYNTKQNNKDILQNITTALYLQKAFGQTMLRDKDFISLLFTLNRCIEITQREMITIGVSRECAYCATDGEGTCCGVRTGLKCDSILLLINLLLGKSLDIKEQASDLCHFLTTDGCFLKVRPIICLNYICHRLRKNIPHAKLVRLQEVTGNQIDTLFLVEEYIKKKIKGFVME